MDHQTYFLPTFKTLTYLFGFHFLERQNLNAPLKTVTKFEFSPKHKFAPQKSKTQNYKLFKNKLTRSLKFYTKLTHE